MLSILLYFCGIFLTVSARPQHDRKFLPFLFISLFSNKWIPSAQLIHQDFSANLCKQQPDLPYCKVEDLEFHISRAEVAEPELGPSVALKKLIERGQSPSGAAPILSNEERRLAIEDSKSLLSVLGSDDEVPALRRSTTRERRHIDDSDDDLGYLKDRRQPVLYQFRDSDTFQRYRSTPIKYFSPDSEYGYPNYGYAGNLRRFHFGLGSGLNVLRVGVSSGLGVNVA